MFDDWSSSKLIFSRTFQICLECSKRKEENSFRSQSNLYDTRAMRGNLIMSTQQNSTLFEYAQQSWKWKFFILDIFGIYFMNLKSFQLLCSIACPRILILVPVTELRIERFEIKRLNQNMSKSWITDVPSTCNHRRY